MIKSIKDLFSELREQNINLVLNDEDKIEIISYKEKISSNLIQEIKDQKSDIINYLKAQKEASDLRIPPVQKSDKYVVSSSQKSLWTLSQLERSSIAYNMASYKILTQVHQINFLKRAIEAVIERHEILRTIFIQDKSGEVNQIILDKKDLNFFIDFQDLRNIKDSTNKIDNFIAQDVIIPFNLEKGPLLRVSFLQLSDDSYGFYYNMHHIISDGWSMDVLEKEVLSFYKAFELGVSSNLPELSIQYKDYAAWEYTRFQSGKMLEHKEYWLHKLSGELPVLNLPINKTRLKFKTYEGHTLRTYIAPEEVLQLRKLVQSNGGSMFMGILAVLKVLLHKYSTERDIIVGFPLAAREHIDLKDQIGFYIKTLVLRNYLHTDDSFISFFQSLRENTLSAYKYQDYPFANLVEDLALQSDGGRNPIYDISLTFHNLSSVSDDITKDRSGILEDLGRGKCKNDIEFHFQEESNYLSFQANYNTDVYEREMVSQLMVHFNSLLKELIADPNRKIAEIDYLSHKEKNQLIWKFNDPNVDYPRDKTIIDIFEDQVNRFPNNIAVDFEDLVLTYKELNEKANQLGNFLREKWNIQSDDLIGIKLDRSEKMIITILGILKSGGAYVPIDPSYPQERIDYIEKDSNTKVIIDEELLNLFYLEQDQYLKSNPHKINNPQDLAYVIYTSGTTGNPKGALLEHKNVVRLFFTDKPIFDFNDKDIWSVFHSYSFDFSVWEMYGALLYGGKLIVVPKAIAQNTPLFLKLLYDKKVTILNQTPSAFYNLIDCEALITFKDFQLRYVIFGGESLNPLLLKDWSKKHPKTKLINMYGITETTVHVTYKEIGEKEINSEQSNIGKPIPTLSCYILDSSLQIVPIKVIGELYISGPGLARGYLNKPELTSEKFVLNPFKSGEKMYKTGDLGRWLPDGNIEYYGRIDDQVKIRGHRIELGEIESNLSQFSDFIRQNLVLVKALNGENTLVAYYISDSKIDRSALRNFLVQRLPLHMVPGFYVQLDVMPLTTNGKIDRRALPEITAKDLIQKQYEAPRNETEKKLVAIWQEVLAIDKIGISDNFFELGGHSLLAVQVFNRMKQELGKKVSFKVFFTSPNIKDLVTQLQDSEYTPIPKALESDSYPLTTFQYRLWLLSQLEAGSLAYNMPTSVKLTGSINLAKFEEAFQLLISRYEILRTYFKINQEGEVRQYIVDADSLNFSINKQFFSNETVTSALVLEYLQASNNEVFDLEKVPLLRASMIGLNDESHVFSLSIHHIIGDGWSMELLVSEIIQLYNSLIQGKTTVLPDLKIQYKDYAVWLNEQTAQDKLQIAEQYWLDQFSGELPVLMLPSFKQRPLIQTYNGDNSSYEFSKSFLEKIQHFSKTEDVTMFMFLMTGVKIVLHKYTNQTDIIVGTPVAGREHPDLENQIGLFLNTLAIRTIIEKQDNFRTLLTKEKETLLGAYEHQGYPFGDLVEKLQIKRDRSRSVLFDVMINLQNQEQLNNLNNSNFLQDLTVEGYDSELTTSKFDLEFTFSETKNGLSLNIGYNTDIYASDQIKKIFVHLEKVFAQVLEEPQIKIYEIDYLSGEEKKELLLDFNATTFDYPKDKNVLDLFQEQVLETPDAIAIIFEDQQITYQELDALSNNLSGSLRKEYGIGKGDMVGVQLNRSQWNIVSILGILKAGAVYIPIDAELPINRKAFIVEDTALKLLITETTFIPELNFYKGAVLNVREGFNISDIEDSKTDKINLGPSDLAYIIYTSGSTGNPKGVMIEHASLANYLMWAREYYLNEELSNKNFGLFTSLSFDLTITSLFLPLISGGNLQIVGTGANVSVLLKEYLESDISCIKLTPAHISVLEGLDIQTNKIELAIVGGEELRKDHIAILKRINPSIRIYNEYGPTEATVGCSIYEVKSTEDHITIGKPIANTSIYILNDNKAYCSIGVSGEIYIGGSGLARGYLNREDLTREKFIAHPFIDSDRVYRTGDIGRWLPDGSIEYLGRIDDQVKIRGYRIELGEIEQFMLNEDYINQAVVIVQKRTDEKYIVAYYVSEKQVNKKQLQDNLRKVLPEYMLPGYYVQLDTIPLTSNGKVDRKALPGIDKADLIKEEYVTARNSEEALLVQVWSDILKHNPISIKDSFYNLGGDSIKSILVISRLKQKGYSLKVDQILRNPVLEDLAKLIENNIQAVDQSEIKGDVVLTPIQRYFFKSETIADKNHYNQSVILKSINAIDSVLLERCISVLVLHHDALRMYYNQKGDIWKQYNADSSGTHYKINFYDLQQDPNELDSLTRISTELQSSLDINSGILFQVGHFRLSEGDRLVLIIHHLVIDGISWRIILEDLSNLYQSSQENITFSLPLKTDSFQRWASLQQEYAKSEKMQLERLYWEEVSKEPIALLPTDYTTAGSSKTKQSKGFVLDKAITHKLQTQSYQVYNTEINDILLTGLGLAVSEVFGIKKSVVRMEGHGREEIIEGVDIGRTVGWFTSIYPFVLDVCSNENVLVSVKESLRKIPNKGIGYGILHYLDKVFSHTLPASIQFNYLGDFGNDAGNNNKESIFEFSSEDIGPSVALCNSQSEVLLDISGMMVGGELSIAINYSGDVFNAKTIEKLIISYENQLRNLIDELAASGSRINKETSLNKIIKKKWNVGDKIELSQNQYRYLPFKSSSLSIRLSIDCFDLNHFEIKFRKFLSQFPVLCLRYEENNGVVIQRHLAAEDVKIEIQVKEVKLIDEKTNIYQFAIDNINRPYNLFGGELIRILVLLDDSQVKNATIIVSIHHSLIDLHSSSLINIELTNYFKDLDINPKYSHPFDFINWQTDFLKSEQGIEERKYWVDSLSKLPLTNQKIKLKDTTSNFIRFSTYIQNGDFELVNEISKNNNLPINSMLFGLYHTIIGDLDLNKSIIGVIVNGREIEVNELNTDQILGVLDNMLPITYTKPNQKFTKDYFINYYAKYLEARLNMKVPFETIRKDVLQKSQRDILVDFAGYFNFMIYENSTLNYSNNNQEKIIVEDINGIHLICILHSNAIELRLTCSEQIYQDKKDLISLDKNIVEFMEFIKQNKN